MHSSGHCKSGVFRRRRGIQDQTVHTFFRDAKGGKTKRVENRRDERLKKWTKWKNGNIREVCIFPDAANWVGIR
jgi:hypothetical protein